MRLRWDGEIKNWCQNFSTFTAGSKFSSITRVIGVIKQFGLRRYASLIEALTMRWRNKTLVTKKSTFTAGSKKNVIFDHNSGNRCDRTVRFVAYAPFLDTLVMLWRNKKSMTKSVHYLLLLPLLVTWPLLLLLLLLLTWPLLLLLLLLLTWPLLLLLLLIWPL